MMKKENIKVFMDKVLGELWAWVFLPGCILLLIFLGVINCLYPHESTFEQDLNYSLGHIGLAFYNGFYMKGYESPTLWFIICGIFLIGSIYFYIDGLRNIKWVKDKELVTTFKWWENFIKAPYLD